MNGALNLFSSDPAALLFWAVATPLIGAVILMLLGNLNRRVSHVVAGAAFTLPLLGALCLATRFTKAATHEGFAFFSDLPLGVASVGISLKMGLNGISMPLFVMAAIVGLAAGLYSLAGEYERKRSYLILLLIMFGGLLGLFASIDLFFFYFFHELALIPTFIMMGIWGGRSRRIAAMELTIYLTFGAMLVLAGLIALYVFADINSFSFIDIRAALAGEAMGVNSQRTIFGLLLFGFGILVSLFPFHTWAPRGYANAPAGAAMLHAGILKKFGVYGLIQFAAPLLPEGAASWTDLLLWLALGNVIIIGLITMAQRDLRYMMGYGSVMHMGYVFLGIATLSAIGVGGAVMLMFAHGCSIALLFLLSDCIARRGGTAEMADFGGLARHTPILAAFFTAAVLASAGLPGFANFWGELSIFIALFGRSPWFGAAAVIGIIISAIYGLRAVARIFFGEPSEAFNERLKEQPVRDLSWSERIPAVVLFIALLAVGIWPRMVGDPIDATVSATYGDPAAVPADAVTQVPSASATTSDASF